MIDDLLTVREACNYLKITRATLYRWVRKGRLHLVKLGERTTRLHRSEIENLAAPRRADGKVTTVTPGHSAVLQLDSEVKKLGDVVDRFRIGEAPVFVFLNQEPVTDYDLLLSPGDLVVIVPQREAHWLQGEPSEGRDRWGLLRLAESSFNRDWDNEQDAIYDNWKELYGVSGG